MVVDTKLYDILQVSPDADQSTIKKAFRKKALKLHPDKPTGNEEKFKELDAAFRVLSTPELKDYYDKTGSINPSSDKSNPFDIDLSQLFGGMFNSFHMNQTPKKGPNTQYNLNCSLETLFKGRKKTLKVQRKVICTSCAGIGGKNPKVCSRCNGQGIIIIQKNNGMFMMQSQRTCDLCSGKGKTFVNEDICKICNQTGFCHEVSILEIDIPAGTQNGYIVEQKNLGDEIGNGISPGDLFIVINEIPHKKFKRMGNDLQIAVTIDLSVALIGGIVEFEHIDGEMVQVKLNKGHVIKENEKMRVPSYGMPILNQNSRGDLIIEFNIRLPSDEWSKKINEIVVKKLLENA